jgi:hypothetical protein
MTEPKAYAHVVDGVVVNVSLSDPDFAAARDLVAVPDGLPVSAGWIYVSDLQGGGGGGGGGAFTAPEPPTRTADEVTELRRLAYAAESDHLFMAWQATVATDAADQDARKAAWLAARDAIRARLPYPS